MKGGNDIEAADVLTFPRNANENKIENAGAALNMETTICMGTTSSRSSFDFDINYENNKFISDTTTPNIVSSNIAYNDVQVLTTTTLNNNRRNKIPSKNNINPNNAANTSFITNTYNKDIVSINNDAIDIHSDDVYTCLKNKIYEYTSKPLQTSCIETTPSQTATLSTPQQTSTLSTPPKTTSTQTTITQQTITPQTKAILRNNFFETPRNIDTFENNKYKEQNGNFIFGVKCTHQWFIDEEEKSYRTKLPCFSSIDSNAPCRTQTTTNPLNTTTNHLNTSSNHLNTTSNHHSTTTNHHSTTTNHHSTTTIKSSNLSTISERLKPKIKKISFFSPLNQSFDSHFSNFSCEQDQNSAAQMSNNLIINNEKKKCNKNFKNTKNYKKNISYNFFKRHLYYKSFSLELNNEKLIRSEKKSVNKRYNILKNNYSDNVEINNKSSNKSLKEQNMLACNNQKYTRIPKSKNKNYILKQKIPFDLSNNIISNISISQTTPPTTTHTTPPTITHTTPLTTTHTTPYTTPASTLYKNFYNNPYNTTNTASTSTTYTTILPNNWTSTNDLKASSTDKPSLISSFFNKTDITKLHALLAPTTTTMAPPRYTYDCETSKNNDCMCHTSPHKVTEYLTRDDKEWLWLQKGLSRNIPLEEQKHLHLCKQIQNLQGHNKFQLRLLQKQQNYYQKRLAFRFKPQSLNEKHETMKLPKISVSFDFCPTSTHLQSIHSPPIHSQFIHLSATKPSALDIIQPSSIFSSLANQNICSKKAIAVTEFKGFYYESQKVLKTNLNKNKGITSTIEGTQGTTLQQNHQTAPNATQGSQLPAKILTSQDVPTFNHISVPIAQKNNNIAETVNVDATGNPLKTVGEQKGLMLKHIPPCKPAFTTSPRSSTQGHLNKFVRQDAVVSNQSFFHKTHQSSLFTVDTSLPTLSTNNHSQSDIENNLNIRKSNMSLSKNIINTNLETIDSNRVDFKMSFSNNNSNNNSFNSGDTDPNNQSIRYVQASR